MKIISGYPNYSIDEFGNVFNKDGKRLKPQKNHKGYFRVYLYDSNHIRKCFLIHRLVAQAFIPNPNDLPGVNHKDTDKKNNAVSNLEWCSGSENIKHAIKKGVHYIPHKLTSEQTEFIRTNYKPRDKKYGRKALAKRFNVTIYAIDGIIYGRTWKEEKICV